MANREEYRFDVNANTSGAEESVNLLINKFAKLEQTINRINKKGFANNYTTNQKDMAKSMRSYASMAKEMVGATKEIRAAIAQAQKDMASLAKPKAPRHPNKPHAPVKPKPLRKNASKESRAKHDLEMKEYDKQYEKFLRREANYQKRMVKFAKESKVHDTEVAQYNKRLQAHEAFITKMINSHKRLQQSLNNAKSTHLDTQGYDQNYSKNFQPKLSGNDLYNMPSDPKQAQKAMKAIFQGKDELESSRDGVSDTIKDVQRLRRRNTRLARTGAATGHLSYQQAKNFHDDYMTSQVQYSKAMEDNVKYASKLGMRRKRLQTMVNGIEQNPEKYGEDGHQKKVAYQRNIEAIDKEIEARKRLNAEYEQTITQTQANRNKLLENNVRTDAERGTFKRNLSERSAAIGLATSATIAGSFVNAYSQGSSIDKAMRPDLIYAGQSTGMDGKQWGQFETNTIRSGLANNLGFTGQEMMSFQNDYLQNAGYHGLNDLKAATTNQAMFSRVSGIDANTTGNFFGAVSQTGGMNGSQVKDFQDAFVGAIKESGMDGRQQQQLQALQGILTNVGADKQLSNSQVNSIVGLQGLLASSGNRSMQGQNGADFMNQMNNGIKGAFDNPQMRLIFGAGTKYQGLGGMWQLQKQMNAGIIGKEGMQNLQTMTNYAMTNGGSNPDAQNAVFAQFAHSAGMNLTTDQIETFMNMARSGKLTDKNVQDFMNKSKATGKKQSDKNAKNYQNSDAATNNQSDANTQAQAKALYDNTKWLRQLNNTMASSLMNHPFMYAGATAAGAALGGGIGTLGGFGISTAIKKFAEGRFGFTEGNLGKYSGIRKFFNWKQGNRAPEDMPNPDGPTTPGTPPPGFHDKSAPARQAAWEQEVAKAKLEGRQPNINNVPYIEPDIHPNNATPKGQGNFFTKAFKSFNGGGKAFSAVSKAFEIAGKVAKPLAIGTGVVDVATAKKGTKVQTAGKAAGGIWGGLAGAAKGAELGADFGPWGALIGGLGGGIAGSGLGSMVGNGVGWLGQKAWNGVTSMFSPTKAEAATLPSSKHKSSPASKQQDTKNTNVKAQTEDKRTTNIQTETTNLGQQSKQITAMEQLLAQARQQNGIIGTLTGVGSGMGGTNGVGGAAGMTNAKGKQADIWNYFAKQGYSASAISGIEGNIGTETGGTFDPTTKQKGGPGRGLAQWEVGGRYDQLVKWAKDNGMDPNAMSTQLQFMTKEMNQMGLTPDKMNNLSTSDATSLFEKKFEAAGVPNMSSRNSYAQQAYNQFANSPQAQPSVGQMTSANTHTINSNINVNLTANGDAASQVASNSQLQSLGQKLQQMIYGTMGYYSTETQRG